ncbi:ATP-binding protein [Lewinella sp. JB7]|uniref:GAF domain-containing sensor histidine kinase n=1 Tax=Lewinella sp. JB7 TaxID=2962887 RepID=UPI0020C9BA5E|nr:ATP-binding protein [Lewinella sp. JB7]MCP9234679.1 ATP-binding protein [Lewinella sp. JB7]
MKTALEVQSYALVLVVERGDLTITAASDHAAEFCGVASDCLLGKPLNKLFHADTVAELRDTVREDAPGVFVLKDLEKWPNNEYQAIVYAFAKELVIEVEPRRFWPHTGDYSARLNDFTTELESSPTIDTLLQHLTDGLTYHLGYDRAIVMQFDQGYNGRITHERKLNDLPSLLNIMFTSSDVPAASRYNQVVDTVHNFVDDRRDLPGLTGSYGPGAREIIRRLIAAREPNVHYVQYLRDNGLRTVAYLSLIVDGKLWGSVYLHAVEPLYLDYQMRAFLRVVGRVVQQKIAYHIYSRALRLRQSANRLRDQLQDTIVNSDNLASGLTSGETTLLDLLDGTHGAAICSDEVLTLHGVTPHEEQINAIMKWLKQTTGGESVWSTDHLAHLCPPAQDCAEISAGLLFLPLDVEANQWIIWFKPQMIQTVTYGSTDDERNPGARRFQLSDQTLHGYSLPWSQDDIGTAQAIQAFIQDVVMKRYTVARKRNELLRQAYEDLEVFSYTVGHDLRAPLRGISSFADILEEDFGDVLGTTGKSHLKVIQDNAERMRVFMSDLLALSRIDRANIIINELSVAQLVERVLADRTTSEQRKFTCTVQPDMPPITGDRNHLITVFTNLISNAIKYSSQREAPRIEVGFTGQYRNGCPVFFVADNGIGIPEDQYGRVFDLFTRSPNADEFQGTGIGLALVKRIVNFHEGDIWIESEVGVGTRFYFYTCPDQ